MTATSIRARLTAALVLGLVVACRDATGPDEREFQSARALWQSHAVANYDYTLRRECFCPMEVTQPMRVQVRGGAVTSATSVATGAAIDVQHVKTVDQIFSEIEGTLSNGKVLGASYDATFGFPVEARLDRIVNAIDDEGNYFISDFQVKS
jgi:hypothetical protein